MCGCTLYDSPSCGHSWISMSQPCGFLSDLLSCPYRQTYQTLIAPPFSCPRCNGGFADHETIEMVQGPWGCNQMIRNHVGGSYAVPGQWGHWNGGPALTSGYGAMVPAMGGYGGYDHRLTGPYGPRPFGNGSMVAHSAMITSGPVIASAPMLTNGPMVYDDYGAFDDGYYDDGYFDDCGWDFGDCRRRRRTRHKTKYKYRYTDTNCTVM